MNERDLAKVSMVRKNRYKGGSQGRKKRALPRAWGEGAKQHAEGWPKSEFTRVEN